MRFRLATAAGLGVLLAVLVTIGAGPSSRAAWALLCVCTATCLAVGVPLRAATSERPAFALAEIGAFVLAALGLAGSWLAPSLVAYAGALSYVALFGLALAGWTCALGARVGQPLATAGALLALSLPYWGAVPLQILEPSAAMVLVIHSPLPVLCGSFAEVDLLRSETLYAVLPQAQAVGYAYVGTLHALGWVALLAALGWGVTLFRRARTTKAPAPVVAAGLLLILLFAPADARAQDLFPPTQPSGDSPIGDLETRAILGYYLPVLEGRVKLSGAPNGLPPGSKISFRRHLDLDPIFVMPTFEIMFGWENAGLIWVHYTEAIWRGETQAQVNLSFEENELTRGTVIDVKYRYRTIALGGALAIPVSDWITLQIVTSTRYIKHELTIRGINTFSGTAFAERNSMEVLVPGLGAGADVLVWDMIALYGSVQWLDFRSSTFGADDGRWTIRFREWHLGVRLELLPHAFLMGEWFNIETKVTDGRDERYKHHMSGVRIMVAVLF